MPINRFLGVLVVFGGVAVIASELARHSSPRVWTLGRLYRIDTTKKGTEGFSQLFKVAVWWKDEAVPWNMAVSSWQE